MGFQEDGFDSNRRHRTVNDKSGACQISIFDVLGCNRMLDCSANPIAASLRRVPKNLGGGAVRFCQAAQPGRAVYGAGCQNSIEKPVMHLLVSYARLANIAISILCATAIAGCSAPKCTPSRVIPAVPIGACYSGCPNHHMVTGDKRSLQIRVILHLSRRVLSPSALYAPERLFQIGRTEV